MDAPPLPERGDAGRAAVSRMHRTNRAVYESVTRLKKLEWLSPPTKNISSDVG